MEGIKELIKITANDKGVNCVSAKELHEGLEIGTEFPKWMARMLKYGFIENEDYISVTQKRKTNNPKNPYTTYRDYIITIEMARKLCRINGSEKAEIIYKYLYEYSDNRNEIFIVKPPRREFEFGEMLEKVTGFHFIRQYPMCNNKYRIDFILEDATLMIEYDEEYHETESQKRKDEERIEECRQWLKENVFFEDWNCPVIRVKKGYELEGLREIIEHLIVYEDLEKWDNECIRNVGESRLP